MQITWTKKVKQYRRAGASELREMVAIDTETYNGDIIVLADSDGNYLDYPNITLENVISFLFRHQYKWIFCWNLGFDGDIITKLLRDELKGYIHTGRLFFDVKGPDGKNIFSNNGIMIYYYTCSGYHEECSCSTTKP